MNAVLSLEASKTDTEQRIQDHNIYVSFLCSPLSQQGNT